MGMKSCFDFNINNVQRKRFDWFVTMIGRKRLVSPYKKRIKKPVDGNFVNQKIGSSSTNCVGYCTPSKEWEKVKEKENHGEKKVDEGFLTTLIYAGACTVRYLLR